MDHIRVEYRGGKMTPRLSAALLLAGICIPPGTEGAFTNKEPKDLLTRLIDKEVDKLDLELLPCFNKCGKPRTPKKLFCSPECCKEYKAKERKK